jgi:hypothetical protein
VDEELIGTGVKQYGKAGKQHEKEDVRDMHRYQL